MWGELMNDSELVLKQAAKHTQIQLAEAVKELVACNSVSAQYGLTLSENDIKELVTGRVKALKDTGRIEFKEGILPKLVYAFCDSQYISQSNYEETLYDLQEAFYYFKNESGDIFSDDELIEFMVSVFNGRAEGSAEYLIGTSLESLCRYAKEGWDPFDLAKAGDLF